MEGKTGESSGKSFCEGHLCEGRFTVLCTLLPCAHLCVPNVSSGFHGFPGLNGLNGLPGTKGSPGTPGKGNVWWKCGS